MNNACQDSSILSMAQDVQEYVVNMRRTFHMQPERGLEEYKTAARIRQELDLMGIPWVAATPTGTVGILRGNGTSSKILGLRADMDALELEEHTRLPYASQVKGMMHACGHDAHTAMLLGAAKIFTQRGLAHLPGTVYLVFQPGEEGYLGAQKMVASGALEGISAIFGQHVMPAFPAGQYAFRSGAQMSGSRIFEIHVKGRGGHGSALHMTADPLLPAAMIELALQTVVSQNVSGFDTASLCVGVLQGGMRFNVVPDEATLGGNIRFLSKETADMMEQRIRDVVEHIAQAFRVEASSAFNFEIKPQRNDPALAALLRCSACRLLGEENVITPPPSMGSEDFSDYEALCPTVFAFVGIGNEEKSGTSPLHSGGFILDEDALTNGTAMYVQFALDYFSE